MIDIYGFITVKDIICILVVIVTMIIVVMPHDVVDTSTCKRSWFAILVLLSALFFLINKTLLGCLLSFILISAWLSNLALKSLNNFKIRTPEHYEQHHKK